MERILPTLINYLVQVPVLLAWLIGLILSIVFWQRHPRVSLLTLIALAVLFVETLIDTYLSLWLPLGLREQGLTLAQTGRIIATKQVLTSLVSAVAWVLVIAAIFGWRKLPVVAREEQIIRTIPGKEDVVRKRHGCLTALLVVSGVFIAVATGINLVAADNIAKSLPNAPAWAPIGFVVLGLLGIIALASLVAIWYWRRWGAYVCGAAAIAILILNLLLGLGITALLGLIGPGLIIGFTLRQWDKFDS